MRRPVSPSHGLAHWLSSGGALVFVAALDLIFAVGGPIATNFTHAQYPVQAAAGGIAVSTLVGFIAVANPNNRLPTNTMRDAIAAGVVLMYLVIVAIAAFFNLESRSDGLVLDPLTSTLISNFGLVVLTIIGFYFATEATQAIANRGQDRSSAPAVVGVIPSSGATAGGDQVTIVGRGFTGATAVAFGSTAAKGFTVVNDSVITCLSPAATVAGAVDVTVASPVGSSPSIASDQFSYLATGADDSSGDRELEGSGAARALLS